MTCVATRCRAYPPLPGVMATVHTYGRDLGWHPHVHVLCTEGGLRKDGVWQPVKIFPAQQYRRLWQHYLLAGLRKKLKGKRGLCRWLGTLYRKYPTGFIVNVMSRYVNGKQAVPTAAVTPVALRSQRSGSQPTMVSVLPFPLRITGTDRTRR